jgi:hypothetical protein
MFALLHTIFNFSLKLYVTFSTATQEVINYISYLKIL